MVTKVEAAKLATSSGVAVVIADGRKPDILKHILQGEATGTMFPSRVSQLESKKRWMLSRLASRGKLIIDRGAAKALMEQNRSLLPAGVVNVEGRFKRGDLVDIHDLSDNHIGCGISNYNSKDVTIIRGAHSEEISKLIGHEYGDEIIHRNNMVLT
jgi:glutamate 5-kinase